MPRAGWAALGAALAASVATEVGRGAALMVVALALVAGTLTGTAPRPWAPRLATWRVAAVATLAGSMLIAIQLVVAPPASVPASDVVGSEGTWDAVVTTVSAPLDGRQRAVVRLADGRLVALTAPRYPQLRITDRIHVSGAPESPPEGPYGDHLRRIGVTATLRSRTLERIGSADDPMAAIESIRAGADRALSLVLPEPEAGLASGILVGLRDRVDRELATDFTTAGVSHVVAISGWNIAVVAAAVGAPLRGLQRGRRALVILVVIAAYTLVAGASPSVVRAALMAGVALTARELGRPGRAASFLAIAALAMLLLDPAVISDAGFRLSVAATAGLLVWASPLARRLSSARGVRLPGWLSETLALSLAAQLATLPIVLGSFGRLSLVAPLANLVVAPLVPPAMAAGVVALTAGAAASIGIGGPLAAALAAPGWALLATLVGSVRVLADVPAASIDLAPPLDLLAAGLAAGCVALALPSVAGRLGAAWRRGTLARARRRRIDQDRSSRNRPGPGGPGAGGPGRGPGGRRTGLALVTVLVLAVVGGTAVARSADGEVRVVVLDVGQGDAILLEGDRGGRLLVDGGPDPERLLPALDARVPPWDRHLDVVLVSHPHEDHVGGLPALLERYRVDRVLETGMTGPGPADRALRDILGTQGRAPERLGTGDRIRLDSVELQVLWPDRASVPEVAPDDGSEVNDRSLVLLGTVGPTRFLLTGDAEEGVDPALLARGLPPVDLLKVAHHGSRTATSGTLLAAIRPRLAMISVGEDNPYGHPAPETLARLVSIGATTYRTDLHGTIVAAFDGRAWAVTTERDRAASAGSDRRSATEAGRGLWPGPVSRASGSLTAGLGYHRIDVGPEPRRGRGDPPVVRSAAVVPASLAGRRRGGRLARGAGGRQRSTDRPPARRSRRPAPRHRQAPRPRGPGPPAAPRRGGRGLARRRRAPGAGRGDRRAPGHPPRRRSGRRRMAARCLPRGARRGLRRQARGAAPRAGRRSLRFLGATLPADGSWHGRDPCPDRQRLGLGHHRDRAGPRRQARARRLRRRRRPARAGPAPRLDRGGPPVGGGRRRAMATGAGHRAASMTRGGPVRGDGPPAGSSGPALGYFRGDDGYELERAADRIAGRLEATSGIAPERRRIDGAATTAGRIAEWVATAPLFGGGTLVVVVEPGPLIRSAADRAALQAVMTGLAPGNGLVFLDPTDGTARRSASSDALRDAVAAAGGQTAEHRAPSEGRLAAWIEARAAERRIPLEPGAARVLGERVGGYVREGDIDRRRMGIQAVNELEKLALYRDGEPIRPVDVEALVAESVPTSTWAFLDALGERRITVAVGALDRLLATTPEPLLLALLHRRLREILEVADRLAAGMSLQAAARELKLKPFRAERLAAQARRWELAELDAAIVGLAELDARVKGVPPASAAQRRAAFVLWLRERVGTAPAR